jgi:organic radical activating enzyme
LAYEHLFEVIGSGGEPVVQEKIMNLLTKRLHMAFNLII